MGEYISLAAGILLFVICAMVIKVYWPRRGQPKDAAFFLGLAIFVAFIAAAMNTAWWQIIVGSLNYWQITEVGQLRPVGLWLDGILKGLAAFAGVLHLEAVRRQLPAKDRRLYHWFEMPWYPKRLRLPTCWRETGGK